MVTVALAGATTGFGLTLLRTFIHLNSTSPKKKHTLILLSRTPQPQFTAQGIQVRPVSYASHTDLVSALRDVHTLLSLIGSGGILDSQLALIAAAREAGVKRFAPSEFAGHGYEGVDLYAPKAAVWEATRKSGMEYTRFECGLFMSVLATGTPKPPTEVGEREGCKTGEEEALSGLRPWNFVLNIRAGTADLAGDGNDEMVLTDMRDIAKFVWRALDLESWPEFLGMRGDVVTFRELIAVLERVSGRKYLVRENGLESLLEEGKADPSKAFYNQARVQLARGWGMVGDDLNRAFPDIETVTCEQFIEKWWGGVELPEPAWEESKTFGQQDFA